MGQEEEYNEQHVMHLIDEALEEVNYLEKQLDEYDSILSMARENAEHLEKKNKLQRLELSNKKRLAEYLQQHLLERIEDESGDCTTPVTNSEQA